VRANQRDLELMVHALAEARRAMAAGEVPVGAIVAVGSEILGRGRNRTIELSDPTAHAEILALREAAIACHSYRLEEASLYVTLEPCVMCMGAIVNARIATLKFGAWDGKAGAAGSVYDIGRDGRLSHRVEIYSQIMAEACADILREFFRARRNIG
jgi:tRNA(adenine34) deaminase